MSLLGRPIPAIAQQQQVAQEKRKKRAIFNDNRDIDQENLLLKIKSNKIVEKYIKDKPISKIIFVKNRLINLLIHE